MHFNLHNAIEILDRTPAVLTSLLDGLSYDWTSPNEGPDTWSAYDIVGHLIHGEKTDWIPRARIILSDLPDKTFEAFDRFAMFRDSAGKTLEQLLMDFENLRTINLGILQSFNLDEKDMERTGIHPTFGEVTMRQLLATWVVHDLNHLGQIARVMARQYKSEVGPWHAFLGILQK
jgi:hypothetical protein